MIQDGYQKSVLMEMVEVVENMLKIVNTPRISIAIYIVNRKGNLRKSARSAALTWEGGGGGCLNPNLEFGSYFTSGRKIFTPSNNSGCSLENLIMGVIMKIKNLRKR